MPGGSSGGLGGLAMYDYYTSTGTGYAYLNRPVNSRPLGGGFISGASINNFVGNGRFKGNQGAGGWNGAGGSTTTPAAANSGAGGAANGPGGSGYLEIAWQE